MSSDASSAVPFEWSDAWLLTSVLLASVERGVASLDEILEAGDMMNKAVFTFREIDGGLARLQASGYVVFEPPDVRPTAIARELITTMPWANVVELLERVRLRLGAPSAPVGRQAVPPDSSWSTGLLTPDDMRLADSTYRRRFSAELGRLREKD